MTVLESLCKNAITGALEIQTDTFVSIVDVDDLDPEDPTKVSQDAKLVSAILIDVLKRFTEAYKDITRFYLRSDCAGKLSILLL